MGKVLVRILAQEKIRERRCVICLPLNWALTLQSKIPELPDADVPGFLEIEAERHFPYGLDAMFVSSSRCRFPDGEQSAAIVGLPRDHILQLQQGLRAAQLKPLSFTLGIAAFQNPEEIEAESLIVLNVTSKNVELMITCAKGIAALRSLEGAIDATEQRAHADAVARELRITLGQIPASLRGKLKLVRILGDSAITKLFAQEISARLEVMGLTVEIANECSGGVSERIIDGPTQANPAICLAGRYLLARRPIFEFLPPKTSAWKQVTTKVSSGKLIWAGATAGSIAVLLAGAFFFQGWKLRRLNNKWTAMESRVAELDQMQQDIRKYRPWFDDSFRTLSILRKLTEAFPSDGVVSAKSVEIRDMSQVSCSGVARDNQAYLKIRDQLQASKEITDVKTDTLRGKSPLQFQINFRWVEGGANESK